MLLFALTASALITSAEDVSLFVQLIALSIIAKTKNVFSVLIVFIGWFKNSYTTSASLDFKKKK